MMEQTVSHLIPPSGMDSDNDGTGNNADTDDDNDTYLDTEDAFPLDKKEWLDTDGDGLETMQIKTMTTMEWRTKMMPFH